MQAAKKPICEICEVSPTAHQSFKNSYDRKCLGPYSFPSFCDQCWKKHKEAERKKEERKKQILALREERIESTLKGVRALHRRKRVTGEQE